MDPFSVATGIANAGDTLYNTVADFFNYDENKRRYHKQMQREDTAIQRRVADLRASGLSPVLAAGQGASSANPMKTGLEKEMDASGAVEKTQMAESLALQMIQQKKQIGQTEAQIELIKSQIGKNTAETDYITGSTPGKIEKLRLENLFTKQSLQDRLEQIKLTNEKIGEDTQLKQLDQKIKEYQIKTQWLDLAKRLLEKAGVLKNLSKMEVDILLKKTLIEWYEAKIAQQNHNLQTHKEQGTVSEGVEQDNVIVNIDGEENMLETLDKMMQEGLDKVRGAKKKK